MSETVGAQLCSGLQDKKKQKKKKIFSFFFLLTRRFSVQGIEHICWGFNLKKSGARDQLAALGYDYTRVINGQTVAVSDCQSLLDDDMATATACAQRYVSNFNSLSASRKSALVDMAFNLGCAGLGSFTRLKAAVEAGTFITASSEIRNSAYCSQVGCRCNVNALCMDPCYALPSSCSSARAVSPPHEVCPTATTARPTPRPTPVPTPAPAVPCSYTSWSNSGTCQGTCGTNGRQTQVRSVLAGVGCTSTSQTVTCQTPLCTCTYSAWTDNGPCTAPCDRDGEYQRQVRSVSPGSPATCTETQRTVYCEGPPCPCTYSAWTDSGSCQAPCGQTGNYQRQTRFVLTGAGCSEPVVRTTACTAAPCNAPACTYSNWAATGSGCPGVCGSSGSRIETRTKQPAGCDDKEGTSRVTPCQTAACPPAACQFSNWAAAGACNPSTCLQSESRSLTAGTPAACAGALQRAVSCACPTPCIWDAWSSWGVCSVCTGTGVQTRTRSIKTPAANNGAQCSGESSQTQPCAGSCPPGGGAGGACPTPTPCKLSDWSPWSDCSPTARKRQPVEDAPECPGQRTRQRRIDAPPCGGGAACPTELTEAGLCQTVCDFQQPPPGVDINGPPPTVDAPGAPGGTDNFFGDSSSGFPLAAIIGIAVGGGLCLILLIAALIVLLLAARNRSPRAGAVAHNPHKDNVIEGNPLFVGQSQKSYNPLFYGNGAANDASVQAARNAVSASYPAAGQMGQPYGTQYGFGAQGAYPTAAGGAAAYPSAGGTLAQYPTNYVGGGTGTMGAGGHYAGNLASARDAVSMASARGSGPTGYSA